MKKLLLLAAAILTMAGTTTARDTDGRVQIGAGLLYENGLELTLGYEKETRHHNAWEFSAMYISNGINARTAVMYARIHSGRTTAHGAWVPPTSPASFVDATIMAT